MGRTARLRGAVAAITWSVIVAGCVSPTDTSSPTSSDSADFPKSAPRAPTAWTHLDQKQLLFGGVFGGEGSQLIEGAVAYRDGFVVVGASATADGSAIGRIWTSPDGIDWSSVDAAAAELEGAEVAWIATDGDELVAMGVRHPANLQLPLPLLIWTSSDGVTWRRIADGRAPFADAFVRGIWGQDGEFLAEAFASDGTVRIARSSNGSDWQAVDVSAFGRDLAQWIVPYRGGWLAVGARASTAAPAPGQPPEPARAWWSADGLRWQRSTVDAGPALFNAYPGAEGVLGVGDSACAGCVAKGDLWQSDGKTWRHLGADTQTFPTYATDGSRIVSWDVQGSGAFRWSLDGVAWTPFGTAMADPRASSALVVGTNGLLIPLRSKNTDPTQPTVAGVLYLEAS